MQNKNNIKNWKIEITNEGAKLFITEGAVMARDVLNLAREQAIKYNLSNLKIYTVYMRDGYYYDYTFEDDMLYFIHMTEKIENEDISYLMKRAAEKLSTLKLDDRIWSVNFSIDNLPREKNGDLYAACAMVIHFYDRNDDYEIDSQRFYFNLSSGQWESIKNVKNKSISCKNSLACKIGDNYFMIQKSEDGYDYTLYTSDYSEIDGGQLDNPDISIYDAMMGCTHCLSDCKPDGEHMTLEVFEDVLKFMIKNQIPTWSFSGGEMFEHPDILKMLSLIESYWKTLPIKYPITFATNGRELVRNKKIYHAVSKFLKHCGKRYVMIQVTDDPRFYPDPLTDNEKYWLSKLGVIIDTVPSDQNNKSHCLYPQGRALKNYSDEYWNTIAPKCINCILITKQKPEATLKDLVNILLSNGKVCTPVIAPDGSIKIGESALCPKIASIYDSVPEIMEKIRNARCRACKIPWEKLKETNPIAYLLCENF